MVNFSAILIKLGGRAVVARKAHNLEVVGSNPTHPTIKSSFKIWPDDGIGRHEGLKIP